MLQFSQRSKEILGPLSTSSRLIFQAGGGIFEAFFYIFSVHSYSKMNHYFQEIYVCVAQILGYVDAFFFLQTNDRDVEQAVEKLTFPLGKIVWI